MPPIAPPPLALTADPLQALFELLDQEPVMFRGISGRIYHEHGDLYFYPDEVGLNGQAYRDDTERLGGEWFRWYLSDDAQALAELAQTVGIPFVVSIETVLLADEDVSPFAQWVEQLLTEMSLD